eukprot:TRINITY_DN11706_c0_g1_i1.p1 TRINITY_DN11706_c0_g1~~TRINITY_DN11706_c0_g1_i1.p1  ORF type:complete len:442 (-),score=59.66 TRINITY_DN11706_c0_g1_i1:43-1368(-)
MAPKLMIRCLLLAAVILFSANFAFAGIDVTVFSSTHIEMNTPSFHVIAQNGNFTFSPISTDPLISASRGFGFFSDYVDRLWWDDGVYPICNQSVIMGRFTEWVHSYERHSNGSVTLYGNSTTVSGCKWRFGMLFVDAPTLYSLPEMNTTLTPDEAKISIDGWCPWMDELKFANPDRANWNNIHLRSRLFSATLETGFVFGEPYTWIPGFTLSKYIPQDYSIHLDSVCQSPSADIISPHRAINSSYDFNDNVGIKFPFQRGNFTMTMLTWARSDSTNHTWAQMGLREYRPFTGSKYFELAADIYFEFVDTVFFDPTLEILFSDPSNTPGGSDVSGRPGSAGGTSPATNSLNVIDKSTGTIVAIVVVVVVAIVAVGFIVLVMKSRRARDILLPFRQRRETRSDEQLTNVQSAKPSEDGPQSQPAPTRKPTNWERAKIPPNGSE